MKTKFIKPDLNIYFAAMPLIGLWIKKDYEKAKSFNDMVDLFHRWMNISEYTKNKVKKNCYYSAASMVYNILKKKRFESKII